MKQSNNPSLRGNIEKLLSEGQTEAAIILLLRDNHPAGNLLKKQYDRTKEEYTGKRITFENWLRSVSHINNAILDLWPEEGPPEADLKFHTLMENLIEAEKTEEALNQMIEKGYRDAVLLKARFLISRQHFSRQPDKEQWLVIQSRIIHAIRSATGMEILSGRNKEPIENPPPKVKNPKVLEVPEKITKTSIQNLLDQGKTAEVLSLLKDVRPDFKLLQEQCIRLEKEKNLGLLTFEGWELQRRRIDFSLNELIGQLPDGEIHPLNRRTSEVPSGKKPVTKESKIKESIELFWNRIREFCKKH